MRACKEPPPSVPSLSTYLDSAGGGEGPTCPARRRQAVKPNPTLAGAARALAVRQPRASGQTAGATASKRALSRTRRQADGPSSRRLPASPPSLSSHPTHCCDAVPRTRGLGALPTPSTPSRALPDTPLYLRDPARYVPFARSGGSGEHRQHQKGTSPQPWPVPSPAGTLGPRRVCIQSQLTPCLKIPVHPVVW